MILLTYGTRPEYIKIKPLIDELKKNKITHKVLFTGQHKDIGGGKFDYEIKMIDYSGNRLDSVIGNLMNIPNYILDGVDYVLVQGDTTSVVGLSLAALHRKIKIIHLEAGLRSYDNENPFPEENNRRIVSTLANIHLCPTDLNSENLKKENITKNVFVVGNTILDNLLDYKENCEYTNKILITLHRRENHSIIYDWFEKINFLATKYSSYEFILPIHPNPNVQKYRYLLPNVRVVNPLEHNELLDVLIKTKLVITDSGGIQEECSFFNKKCLVCRKVTERPESIGLTSFIVESPTQLEEIFDYHISNFEVDSVSPYGDGKSSVKICEIFKKIL